MDQSAQNSNSTSTGSPLSLPQLSCELCRTRKIKCDKLQPCAACASTGAQCVPVYRLRLPRGRHVHNSQQQQRQQRAGDDDLRRRIRRLETLVNRANPGTHTILEASTLEQKSIDTPFTAQYDPGSFSASSHAASVDRQPLVMQHPDHFWADLTEEIHGLRDVVESSPEEAEDDTAQTDIETSTHSNLTRPGIGVLGLSNLRTSLSELGHGHTPILEDRVLVAKLCDIYLQQVDPIVKILHRPSITKHLVNGEAYLSYPKGHIAVEALDAAVLYVAVNSMVESQCERLFSKEKAGLLADCRRSCEFAIERAGLLTTRDMSVLQAFILYLAGRQVEEQSRAVWTLLAVAVRVAKALSLNLEPNTTQSQKTFFVQQMRRHLWMTICLMDVQAAFSMTSQPLIPVDEAMASYRLPRHINDVDYGPQTQIVDAPPDRLGLTDTTYATIKYRLQKFGRLTNFGPAAAMATGGGSELAEADARQKLADVFAQDIMARVFLCDPEQSSYAWLVFHSAQCFVAGARVTVLRKPLGNGDKGSGKERGPPRSNGNLDLLRACAQVLEKTVLMHTDPRGEGFRWAVTVRWHGLAIALAEFYLCASADEPDVDILRIVWPTIEASYSHHESIIAQYRGGKLKGPLGKLMARTRQKLDLILGRDVELRDSQTAQSPLSNSMTMLASTTGTVSSVDDPWDTTSSWDTCWDDLVLAVSFDDDFASFDTQYYE